MLYIEALEIDDHILEKIESKHDIEFHEIEEACFNEDHHVRRGREELYKIFSQTEAGRYIIVVLADRGSGVWKVVTSRNMTDSERQLYIRTIRG